mgnify:CR=1 FL=1
MRARATNILKKKTQTAHASYPRARKDATKLHLAIKDGESEKRETLATSSKEPDKQI